MSEKTNIKMERIYLQYKDLKNIFMKKVGNVPNLVMTNENKHN